MAHRGDNCKHRLKTCGTAPWTREPRGPRQSSLRDSYSDGRRRQGRIFVARPLRAQQKRTASAHPHRTRFWHSLRLNGPSARRVLPFRTDCPRCTAKEKLEPSKPKPSRSTKHKLVKLTPGNFLANSYARLTSSDCRVREVDELMLGSTTIEYACPCEVNVWSSTPVIFAPSAEHADRHARAVSRCAPTPTGSV